MLSHFKLPNSNFLTMYIMFQGSTTRPLSRVISVITLDNGHSTGGLQDWSANSVGGVGAGADLSLVLMVWKVEDAEAALRMTYLGLWDINCWYQVWTCGETLLNDDNSSGGMILMIPPDLYKLSDRKAEILKALSEILYLAFSGPDASVSGGV